MIKNIIRTTMLAGLLSVGMFSHALKNPIGQTAIEPASTSAPSVTNQKPANAAQDYTLGQHYQAITPAVRTSDPEKIEVVAAFSYACIHCWHFEKQLKPWAATLPADVTFLHAPVMFNESATPLAQAYYTAKQLDVLQKMHPIIFKAVFEEKKQLNNESQIEELFVANGVKKEDFVKTFNSFTVKSLLQRDDANVRSYGITGTPELVVDGKYRISAQDAGGSEAMLKVASFLIGKERQERASKASDTKK